MVLYKKVTKILVLFGILLHATLAFGQKLYVPRVPDTLAKFEDVAFYLVTAGIGTDLASRFGHTGIRIIDPHQGVGEARDVVYNWGKFSFKDPGFAWKFFRGSLTYSMGVRTFQNDVSIYQEANRFLVMEPITLTLQQKRDLYQRIATNARPENREFPYQYWFKNCSTIPRDLIDLTTQGAVKGALASAPAQRVYRDYVIRNLSAIPFVVPGLDIMMNGQIDRPISKWEEMFLPEKLREHLQSLPAFDDSGNPIPGTRLLGESKVLVNLPEQYQRFVDDYMVLVGPLWIAFVIFVILKMIEKKTEGASKSIKILGIGLVYYGALFGLFGFVLLFNWAFSGHPDGWANKNLLFFWPTDFVYCWIGLQLMKRNSAIKNRIFFPYDISIYGGLKILATLYFVLTLVLPEVAWLGAYQDMTRIFLWFGTGTLVSIPLLMLFGLAYGPGFKTSLTPTSRQPQVYPSKKQTDV